MNEIKSEKHKLSTNWRGYGLAAVASLGLLISTNASAENVAAYATIEGCTDGGISGFATLSEQPSDQGVKQIDVYMMVNGLSAGEHAVHIHETGVCTPCGDAQGHFDPGNFGMTNPDANHPYHSGDLINIESDGSSGVMTTQTSRITLSPGPLSLFDADGSSFIIHDNPDSYCPDGEEAGCAGGSRAACGIIRPIDTDDNFSLKVSYRQDRNEAKRLSDADLDGDAYVFLAPKYPNESISSVSFYFDGRHQKVESYAPYDLFGTYSTGNGAPFRTKYYENGKHNLAAIINFASGRKAFVASEFTITNSNSRRNRHRRWWYHR